MIHFKLRARYCEEAGTDGSKDGGAGGTAAQNNEGDKVDNFDDIWNTGSNGDGDSNGEPVQQVHIVNQTEPTQLTPEQKLAAHIDSLGLMEGFDQQAMADPEKAEAAMKSLMANTYSAAIKDANQIMDQRIDSLREELQQETQDTMRGNESINAMNSALKYTSQPAYKPVAEALLVKFQNKGASTPEAIKKVGEYFNKLSSDVADTVPRNSNNRMNGSSFNNSNSNSSSGDADPEDWMEFLSAKPK